MKNTCIKIKDEFVMTMFALLRLNNAVETINLPLPSPPPQMGQRIGYLIY